MPKIMPKRTVGPTTQFRNLVAGAFHDEPLTFSSWRGVSYFIYGKEICPKTGRPHLQFYVEFNSSKTFATIKKRYPKLNLKARDGTAQQAADYCKKDQDYVEFGQISVQGERTDLAALCLSIRQGEITTDDVLCQDPMAFHQYGRTFMAAEDWYYRSVKRTTMTTCDWYVGPTGSGKSHTAYTKYPDAYDYPYDADWCDGYRAQETMIVNDFRGQIRYSNLLRIIDKWPCTLRRRNGQPRPFVSKHVVITSIKRPEEVFCNLAAEDDIEQLLRRVNVITLEKRALKN